MRKLRTGFTLVEIIVSLAILIIITGFLLSTITGGFGMIISSRGFTGDTFTAVRQMEKMVMEASGRLRKAGSDSSISVSPLAIFPGTSDEKLIYPRAYTLFSGADATVVEVYELIAAAPTAGVGDEIRLYTVVGPFSAEYPAPKMTELTIELSGGTTDMASYHSSGLSAAVISSECDHFDDRGDSILEGIKYQWYVSRKGFNQMYFTDASEADSELFPSFPVDYELIPGEKGTRLASMPESYAGRHVLLAATPYSKIGKMGDPFPSNNLYISALPSFAANEGQVLWHYDAGLIDRALGAADVWKDFRAWSIPGERVIQPSAARQPGMLRTITGTTQYGGNGYAVYTPVLNFDGTDDVMTANKSRSDTSEITIFAAVRNKGSGGEVVSGNNWSLGFGGLTVTYDTDYSVSSSIDREWRVISAVVEVSKDGEGNPTLEWSDLTFGVDASKKTERFELAELAANGHTSDTLTLASGEFKIGGTATATGTGGAYVAEVVAYGKALSTGQYAEVLRYFADKYGITM